MRRVLLILGTTILTTGCVTSQRVQPHEDVAPAANVSLTFTPPRDLRDVTDSAGRVVRAVRSVTGRVESVRGDTVVVRARSLASDGARFDERYPPRLLVVRDSSIGMRSLRFSTARTAGVTLALAAVAITLAALEWADDFSGTVR